MIFILIILGVIFFVYFKFFYKRLKLPNVYLVTGGVKTGKSFISVALAFAKLIGLAILVIPAVLLDITQIVFWVIGFIPYVLSF